MWIDATRMILVTSLAIPVNMRDRSFVSVETPIEESGKRVVQCEQMEWNFETPDGNLEQIFLERNKNRLMGKRQGTRCITSNKW